MSRLALLGGEPAQTRECPRWPVFDDDLASALIGTLKEGVRSELTGHAAQEFGQAFAQKFGARYGVPVCNGTAAIHLALIALGINPGDEVLVPAHTFIGSATPILMQNAVPIFVDVDEETYTMDPRDLAAKITKKSKAIVVVHLNGNPANMDEISRVARAHNLKIIEDCAQAHGAQYAGKYVGTIGDIGTFSFWEDKIMTTMGEGGMLITDDPEYAELASLAKSHGEVQAPAGTEREYVHGALGYNYRMTDLQGVYGLHELRKLDSYVKKRRENAAYLTEQLGKFEGIYPPRETTSGQHVFYKYVVKVDVKQATHGVDWMLKALRAEGISVSKRYPLPLHLQPLFRLHKTYGNSSWPYSCLSKEYEYAAGLCPVAEKLGGELLTLLVHPTIDIAYLQGVIEAFRKVWQHR